MKTPFRNASVIASLAWIALLPGCTAYHGETEETAFRGGGGIELRATLAFPKDAEPPYPAVILLHGAERATRNRMVYPLTANVFLERGLAVLVYDKRGAGESGGSYESTTYALLVEDATAAVAYLRRRADIDGSRIGLLGISESGWLTPEIAERSGGLAFVINKVGSALSVRDTVAWERYHELLADGADERSAREQIEVYRRLWAYRLSPTEEQRLLLENELAAWSGRTGSGLPDALRKVSPDYLADLSYDPTPFLERARTPFLYLYGSEDVNIPTRDCVNRLADLASRNRPVSHYVFDGEGHELGGFSPLPPFYAFVDGYAELLGEFAQRHTSR